MGTTPQGLRYPATSDPPNGPLQVGDLAVDVDAKLADIYARLANLPAVRYLGSNLSTANGFVNLVQLQNIHTLTVTVPSGLPSTARIKVFGTVFLASPSGVGCAVAIRGGAERPVAQSMDSDLGAFFYDSNLTSGLRTYNLQARSTVSGQSVTWRSPFLSAEVV